MKASASGTTSGRGRQRARTRKDILRAAARLVKAGRKPSMDDVADEAMVSRATAYRYFPNLEALLAEAPLDGAIPEGEAFFADDASTDPVARLDRAEAALHELSYGNEAQLRVMLAQTLAQGSEESGVVRQNRRLPLIEAALAPTRERMSRRRYERLCHALSLVFGTESMVVFRDVVPLDPDEARAVKRWIIEALVKAALADGADAPDGQGGPGGGKGSGTVGGPGAK